MPPISNIILVPLPLKVKGFCHYNADGTQTIVLNSLLTHEANFSTYNHELNHYQDFDCQWACDINFLETIRHE